MVPRKYYIEHADEIPITEVANIADRDVAAVVEALDRIWVPQCKPVIFRRELLLVDVERLIYGHDGRRVEVYLWAQPSGRIQYVGLCEVDITIALGVKPAKQLVVDSIGGQGCAAIKPKTAEKQVYCPLIT